MDEKLKIIIIDDNPDDRLLVERTLRKEFKRIEVIHVKNEKEFKQYIQGCDFDIVITDYRLRWSDGIEVLTIVKKICPDKPVIMFTATGTQEVAVQAMKLGLDDYVIKSPHHFKRLPPAIRSALQKVKQRKALQEAEERYRKLFTNIPVGLYRTTPEGKIVDANPALVTLLGFDNPEELLRKNVREFFVKEEEREKQLATLKEKGVVTNYQLQLRTRTGEILWVEDSVRAILDEKGNIIYLEGIITDITGKKKAEENTKRLLKQLKENFEGIILVLSETVEEKDPYTAGHQKRVAHICREIAEEMGLPEEQITGLYYGALIHDIGKLSIPAEILSRSKRLNEAEFNLIKSHPEAGYRILSKIKFPWPISKMVLQHHERMNGSGYPGGLKGDEILIEARILAVADVVEAMSSHRPYRPAYRLEEAIEEIERNRGKLYDPDVVDACILLYQKGKLDFLQKHKKTQIN